MLLATLLLAACSTPPQEAPPPAPAPPEPELVREDAPEQVSLVIEKVRYDMNEKLFFLEAHVEHRAAVAGGVESPREDPLFVGVTLITPEGEELDLAIATRFPGAIEEPFFISTELDKPVLDMIVGVWDRKIEPCDSERPGCKEFGFLLDGPLAAWPPLFYSNLERQRIPPERILLAPRSAGASATELQAEALRAQAALTALLEPFGTAVELAPAVVADAAAPSRVRASNHHDQPVAAMLAETLSTEQGSWERGPLLVGAPPEMMVFELGGLPAHHACLAEHCAQASDLAACEAASCQ